MSLHALLNYREDDNKEHSFEVALFAEALAEFGLGRGDIVENVNFFMHVPVGPDGHMAIADGLSKPGDYVVAYRLGDE